LQKRSSLLYSSVNEGNVILTLKRRYDAEYNDTRHSDTQYNDTRHTDTQYNDTIDLNVRLSVNKTQHNVWSVVILRVAFILPCLISLW
jgi:hypothetical protein